MGESSGSGLTRKLAEIGKCDGYTNFRTWRDDIRNAVNLYAPELKGLLNGQPCPADTPANMTARASWKRNNGQLFSLLFFATSGSALITVRAHEGKAPDFEGNGAAAWKALADRFDSQSREARRACHAELYGLKFKSGGDPTDFFSKAEELKMRFGVLGGTISDDEFLDLNMNALTAAPEFRFIKEMDYREGFRDLDQLRSTATKYFIDKRSRQSPSPAVAGRGAAMAAASSTDQCHQCKAFGHFKRDCPQHAKKGRPKKGKKKGNKGVGDGAKWCSYHNSKMHSDAECNKQKELRQLGANLAIMQQSGLAANFANVGSAHLVSPAQIALPQPLAQASYANVGAGSAPSASPAQPALPQPYAPMSYANIGSAHPAQPSPPEPSTFGFSFNAMGNALTEAAGSTSVSAVHPSTVHPSSSDAKPETRDSRLPSGVFSAFMATPDLSDVNLRSDGSWIKAVVDSGASENYLDPALTPGLGNHMRDVEILRVPHMIVAAGQHLLRGVATGTVVGTVTDDAGNDRPFSFHAVLVPGMGTNLFSVGAAMVRGVAVLFYPDNPRMEKNGVVVPMQPLGVDPTTGKLLCSVTVKLGGVVGGSPDGSALKVETASLWHRRMGHINSRSLDVLRRMPGNGVDYIGDVEPCDTCPLGKSTQQPHPKQATYDVRYPFQFVLLDTLGPIGPAALGGYKYATKIVDQVTKWKEVVLMKDKTHTVESFELFNKSTVIPSGWRIERARGDQGSEFTSASFRQYCLDLGIVLELAATNTPQQIGANERAGRTLVNMVRCILADSGLPKFLWGELMLTATYLSNRSPHAALKNETPYKKLYGKDANLVHLRVIGARAFVHKETHIKKLENRAWEGRLVGYSMDSKTYRIYNAETRSVRESRNVIFIETPSAMPPPDISGFDDGEFTYNDLDDMVRDVRNYTFNQTLDSHSPDQAIGDPFVVDILERIRETTDRDLGIDSGSSTQPDGGGSEGSSLREPGAEPSSSPSLPSPSSSTHDSVPTGPLSPSGASSPGGSARGGTTSRGARDGRDTRGGSRGGRGSTSMHQTRSVANQPNAKTISELKRLSFAYSAKGEFPDVAHKDDSCRFAEYAYAVGNAQSNAPHNMRDALARPDGELWDAAAKREIKSLQDLGVYKLVPRSAVPRGQKVIGTKWVMKVKADNTHKARLVAQGWNQVHGLDCGSTFAPVCRLQSLRMLYAIVAEHDLELQQMDVVTAFLYSDLQESVFVEQPPGFEIKDKDGGDLVWKLEKSLYGLAQSPGNWFKTIDPAVIAIGFVPLKSDPCVYIYVHDGVLIILTLYVDDFLLAGDNINEINRVKEKLQERFKMTDMGEASLVLGMQITRDRQKHTLTVSQENYVKSVLERFGMAKCKPMSTPGYGGELSAKLREETKLNEEETRTYQAITGSLMYAAQNTRWDIMYSTCQLARFSAGPHKEHLIAAKHTLRYLAGTIDFSIVYKKGGFKLTAFSDSNWANNPDNGKSTSCYIMMLANAPISFKSGMQSLTAMSTMEAELVASALAMKEAVFCSNMLTELGFGKEFAKVPVFCDNTATLHVLGNRTYSSRTKHIALRFFYIRELVSEGRVSVNYIPTDQNPADIGTKHLNKQKFKPLVDRICNFDVNKFLDNIIKTN